MHPTNRSYATGKIFWQCLNDANWLVYVSQAYDCIYNYLSKEERDHLETDLFRPFADFLSIENPKFFNRIHNHSTWANAAVGMIALVMNDEALINRALYGLKDDGIDETAVDNDGGYIKVKGGRKAGFLAQLDYSFAPDGYFTEGPYYLRYAIFPFLVFAKSLENHRPELNILDYRQSILEKAVYALLLQTDAQGQFFPLNDSQKGMSWDARELITAINLIYAYKGNDPTLLSIAKAQDKVIIDDTGFAVAKGMTEGKAEPFIRKSIIFGDGKLGNEGGVAVIRKGSTCMVMKYSAQGMGHGHFDKLSYSLYDDLGEILQDYGAVRWVNIDQKGGGRYLPEYKTFGKQSIAHNTLVVDETSHYNASVKKGEMHHPEIYYSNTKNPSCQIISAVDNHAYEDTDMQRTLVMISDASFVNPIVVDVIRGNSKEPKRFDLPHWYMGHLLSTNVIYDKELVQLSPLGDAYGYEHIWKEANGTVEDDFLQLNWFGNGKFYTMSSTVMPEDEFIFGRSGANDPNFNLRNDPVFIHRRDYQKATTYANIIESHGHYDPISEIPIQPYSTIKNIKLVFDNEEYTVVQFSNSENNWTFAISNLNNDENQNHQIQIEDEQLSWSGVFNLSKNRSI